MATYTQDVDIANRAIQHCGARRIASLSTTTNKQATELNFCYDKIRVAELRRTVWRFATRRATVRLMDSNTRILVPDAYNAATTYAAGALIQDTNGVNWISIFGANTGHTPGTYVAGRPQWWEQYFGSLYASLWSNTGIYYSGEIVYKAGPTYYVNNANGTTVSDPASGAPWITVPGSPTTLIPFIPGPVGVGMTWNGLAQGIYPLPNGFLRLGAPDPRSAGVSVLPVSGGVPSTDWSLESNYIVTSSTTPLFLRFVANISDVSAMDPLFCEGLAARVAYEVCETLTQSNIKLQAIASAYQRFMRDARLVNLIEIGSSEPEEDEYELTRGPQGVVEGVPAANAPAAPGGQAAA